MEKFQQAKHGYNKEQVDSFVNDLNAQILEKDKKIFELEKELAEFRAQDKEIKQKSENISIALTAAVEKAKQIEKSSYNVYQLKIQELDLLYNRWEKVLNELVDKYPNLEEVDNVKRLLSDFKNAIKASVKEDFRIINPNQQIQTDPMRALLSKMNASADRQVQTNKKTKTKHHQRLQLPKDMQAKQTEIERLEDKSIFIKPIYDAHIEAGEKFESLADKFLTQNVEPDSAYASKIANKNAPQETGFNLKEAVNPKADLEEIMKSFDFFENN